MIYRHGSNPGSVRLGGQRHPIGSLGCEVWRERRVWSRTSACTGRRARWTRGCSARSCLGSRVVTTRPRWEAVQGAIGLSKSTVSREFKKGDRQAAEGVSGTELTELDVVALFPGRKTFANDEIVVALAVTMGGEGVCGIRADGNGERPGDHELSALPKGSGTRSVGRSAGRDRRRQGAEVGSDDGVPGPGAYPALPMAQARECGLVPARTEQKAWRGRLQRAYERPTYEEAKRDLKSEAG